MPVLRPRLIRVRSRATNLRRSFKTNRLWGNTSDAVGRSRVRDKALGIEPSVVPGTGSSLGSRLDSPSDEPLNRKLASVLATDPSVWLFTLLLTDTALGEVLDVIGDLPLVRLNGFWSIFGLGLLIDELKGRITVLIRVILYEIVFL